MPRQYRMNSATALRHTWIRKFAADSIKKTERVPALLSGKAKTGKGQRLLRQAVLTYLTQKAPENEIELMRKAFVLLDEDCDGYVTQDDFIPHLQGISPYTSLLEWIFSKMSKDTIETLSFDRTFLLLVS
jgi:hypothetical protein